MGHLQTFATIVNVVMVALPLLVLLASPQQPDTSVRVTFRSPAAPMGRVLQALSDVTKIPFDASKFVAPDIAVIDVKDVTVKDLMDRMALADTAEWTFENGSFHLAPAQGKRALEARKEIQKRAGEFRKSVNERLHPKPKPIKRASKSDEDDDEGSVEDPQSLVIFKLLAQLNPTDIGAMERDGRLVYSTNPTPMQRPLGPGTRDLIQGWVRMHNALVTSITAGSHGEMPDTPDEQVPDMFKEMIFSQTRFIKDPVAKTILVINGLDAMTLDLRVELRAYDASGKVLLQAQAGLDASEDDVAEPDATDSSARANASTPIELSEDSKLLEKALGDAKLSEMNMTFPAQLKEKLLRPDLVDPLSFHATDTLFSYAKWKKKPLVAIVPDSMGGTLEEGVPTSTLEEFESELAKSSDFTVHKDSAWIVLSPKEPATARESRLDRGALTRLVQAGASSKGVRLDDLAAYALANASPMRNGVASLYLFGFAPEAFAGMVTSRNAWTMLRFYGSLSVDEKRVARSGQNIPFVSFDAGRIRLVSKMVYGSNSRLTVDRPGQAPKPEDDFGYFDQMLSMMGSKDFRDEPTEVLPTGVPVSGGISVEAIDDYFVTTKGAEMGWPFALGAEEIALFKLIGEDSKGVTDNMHLPTEGKLGQRTVLKFTFHFTPSVRMKQTLNDDFLPSDAKTVRLDSLPEAFQRRIAQRLEAMKKGPLGRAGAFGSPPEGESP